MVLVRYLGNTLVFLYTFLLLAALAIHSVAGLAVLGTMAAGLLHRF